MVPYLWQIKDFLTCGAVQAHWPDADQLHVSQTLPAFSQHLACTCQSSSILSSGGKFSEEPITLSVLWAALVVNRAPANFTVREHARLPCVT